MVELNARTSMCIRKVLVKLSTCKVLLMDFGSVRHSKKVTCTLCLEWFVVRTCQVYKILCHRVPGLIILTLALDDIIFCPNSTQIMNNIKIVLQLIFHLKATKFTLLLGLPPVKTWLKHSTIWTASYAYKSVHRT